MEEYVIMSLEDAKKVAKKDAIVLVSKQDLEQKDVNSGFTKSKFGECHNILEQAALIAKVCDEFAAQLRVFSDLQIDDPKGIMHTIMLKSCKKLE